MSYRMRSGALVCALGAVFMNGCGEDAPSMPFGRCYDRPQPVATTTPTPAPVARVPIILNYNEDDQRFRQEPWPNNGAITKLEGASFSVYDSELLGSGFVVKAPDGDKVGVTAAHLLQDVALRDIMLVDAQGEQSRVLDGCYMYEDNGRFESKGIQPTDVAVLRLSKPIGSSALTFAATPPKRSDWVGLVNHQNKEHYKYTPVSFQGVVTSWQPGKHGNVVLTGLQPHLSIGSEREMHALQPGGSGGIVGNLQTGEVYGMTVGGADSVRTTEELDRLFGVRLSGPINSETGIVPVEGYCVGSQAIKEALGSPRYRD